MSLEKIIYETQVTATGGRDGACKGEQFEVKLSMPKALGGPGGSGTNPEQLFAAGYAACFLSALKLVAKNQGIVLDGKASVTATVAIGPVTPGFGLQVGLSLDLKLDSAQGTALMEAAHQICPYSRATRGNIEVTLTLV